MRFPDEVGCGTYGSNPQPLDLLNPTTDEDRKIETLLGISIPTRGEMQEIEVSARLYNEDGAEFMTIAAVTRIDTDDPILTLITFVLKSSTLVTVRCWRSISYSRRGKRPPRPIHQQLQTPE